LIRALPLVALMLPLAAACGPVSEELAYEQCTERAMLAAQPRGEIGIGVGSDGPAARGSVTISSDFIAGRDPQLVYENCFRNLTGAGPTRPLIL
jgi:ABC-type amino acid transport substrate-binding protein